MLTAAHISPYNQDSRMVTTPADNLSSAIAVRRRLWPRLVLGLILAVLLVLVGVSAYFYSVARSALPQLDGTITVSGLSARVDVTRHTHAGHSIEAKAL